MRIVIAGAHGQIARRLGRLLSARGDTVVGHHPQPRPRVGPRRRRRRTRVVLDLETASVERGRGGACRAPTPWSSPPAPARAAAPPARTPSTAGPPSCSPTRPSGPACARYLLVSSMGVEQVADGRRPKGMDEVFVAYLRAKLRRRGQDLLPRPGPGHDGRCGPGGLTDDPGTGRVTLGHGSRVRGASRATTSPPSSPSCCDAGDDRRRARAGRRAHAGRRGGRGACLDVRPGARG